ncbi:MAG: formylglycine-generating enzyme family protein [Candidatus Aphodosoma sp.]
MKNIKYLLISLISLFGSLTVVAQTVSNAAFEQVDNRVKITYQLDKSSAIRVYMSEDGGRTFKGPLQKVTGDVGSNVTPGSKVIWWNPLSEYEQIVGSNICFKVMAGAENRKFSVGDVQFTMVYVEGGTFTMGATTEHTTEADSDERPTHKVTLSDYYIGETEVTQALWNAVMGTNPSYFAGNNNPVEQVSYTDCIEFINKLNEMFSGQLNGMKFALPTEAQWEFAARGGNKSRGYKYSGSSFIGDVAWDGNNSDSKTHPVAQKKPNELGLYDMSGNVWEWCRDWYGSYSSSPQINPMGPTSGSYRVFRGGSWYFNASSCRVSYRGSGYPSYRYNYLGFRLALFP